MSVRTIDFCNIFYIKRAQFIEILRQFPSDFEKFHMLKDKINLYKNCKDFNLKCFLCQ